MDVLSSVKSPPKKYKKGPKKCKKGGVAGGFVRTPPTTGIGHFGGPKNHHAWHGRCTMQCATMCGGTYVVSIKTTKV